LNRSLLVILGWIVLGLLNKKYVPFYFCFQWKKELLHPFTLSVGTFDRRLLQKTFLLGAEGVVSIWFWVITVPVHVIERVSLNYQYYFNLSLLSKSEKGYCNLLIGHPFNLHLGICIAPTQPFRAALGAESRVCYPGNMADRQTQWAFTYYHLLQSTEIQNGKLIHCHRWDSNLWSSGC
jgi:hypothetical protein